MNTRQKLSLGVAAIFMVTLTIVGVTYAYFVTRVNSTSTTSADVTAATVGSIEYVPGNGETDSVVLGASENKFTVPGTTIYKSFSVVNKDVAQGVFTLFMDSMSTAGKQQFVHGTATDNCYPNGNGTAVGTITAASLYDSMGVNVSDDTLTGTPTTGCFNGTEYDNIAVTLYEVSSEKITLDEDDKDEYAITPEGEAAAYVDMVDDAGTVADESKLSSATVLYPYGEMTKGVVKTVADTNAGAAQLKAETLLTQDNGNGAGYTTIPGLTIKHYVLKVEYLKKTEKIDEVEREVNQNIENSAQLTLKVNIRSAA